MGWKTVKEHYRIGHLVQVTGKGICIGSPYVNDIIVVGLDGKVVKRYDERSNENLARYQREFDSDPGLLRSLVGTPDAFSAAITVYTYEDGEIIEKHCEETGWPNVTHDGEMMYDNTFSTDKAAVVTWAKDDADATLRFLEEAVGDAEKRLAESAARRDTAAANRRKLEADYPTLPSPSNQI